jgi:DNA-binding NarL/FixJ family response regulator
MIKLLIVDDNASFRRSLAEHLTQQFPDINIAEAADAEGALEKVKAFAPHLSFVDIQLPGESGLELTRKIKADQPEVVIAILTGHDLPEYREAARQLGADYFFSKSAPLDEVFSLVKTIA